jgi:hypothetical protein
MATNFLQPARSALLLTFIACFAGWAAAASAPPAKILVVDPTALPGIVQLDPSPGVQAQRSAAGVTPEQAAAQDIQEVQSALSQTLVKKIQAMGLQAEPVPAGTLPGPDELAVTMQITAIQEGNRARRTVIGFGAGKVSVRGNATLLGETSAGPEVLKSFSTSADSGHMPGMGVGAAAGGAKSAATAISGAAHGNAEIANTPVAEEATKVANHFATSLGQYFAAQAWIAPSAIP